MNMTMAIVGMSGAAGGIPDALKLCMVFGLGMVLPLLAITLVIMAPIHRARDSDALGLGETSLQEEFWQFIDDVERGRVPAEQSAAAALVAAVHHDNRGVVALDRADQDADPQAT